MTYENTVDFLTEYGYIVGKRVKELKKQMKLYKILLTDETGTNYERVAELAGFPVEQVLSDALFKLAGELSMEALGTRTLEELEDLEYLEDDM